MLEKLHRGGTVKNLNVGGDGVILNFGIGNITNRTVKRLTIIHRNIRRRAIFGLGIALDVIRRRTVKHLIIVDDYFNRTIKRLDTWVTVSVSRNTILTDVRGHAIQRMTEFTPDLCPDKHAA